MIDPVLAIVLLFVALVVIIVFAFAVMFVAVPVAVAVFVGGVAALVAGAFGLFMRSRAHRDDPHAHPVGDYPKVPHG